MMSPHKTSLTLNNRLVEAKMRLDAALMEIINNRNRLRDEVDRLSSDRRAFSFKPSTIRRQLEAGTTEIEIVS